MLTGTNFKDDWPVQLANIIKKDTKGKPEVDVVIDSAGGITGPVGKLLKIGGIIVCYGM